MPIYDRELSAEEMNAWLCGQGSKDGLPAAWDFVKTNGNTVPDVSGHLHGAKAR